MSVWESCRGREGRRRTQRGARRGWEADEAYGKVCAAASVARRSEGAVIEVADQAATHTNMKY